MNDHRVRPGELPQCLYLVLHEDSQAKIYPAYGIRARDCKSYFPYEDTEVDFVASLEQHLDWQSRVPSPYISVMSDLTHAENWALDCAARQGSRTYLYEIHSNKLATSYIFRAAHLRSALRLNVPRKALNYSEYLILHRIPIQAIIRRRSSDAILEARG